MLKREPVLYLIKSAYPEIEEAVENALKSANIRYLKHDSVEATLGHVFSRLTESQPVALCYPVTAESEGKVWLHYRFKTSFEPLLTPSFDATGGMLGEPLLALMPAGNTFRPESCAYVAHRVTELAKRHWIEPCRQHRIAQELAAA